MNVAQVSKNQYKVEIPYPGITHRIALKPKNEVYCDRTNLLLSRNLSGYNQFTIKAFTK
jgi:hypothetical protein